MLERSPIDDDQVLDTRQDQLTAGNWTGEEPRTFAATTISEAVDLACSELGISRENLTYEIRNSGLLNLLGYDSELATIMVHPETFGRLARKASGATTGEQRTASASSSPSTLDPRVLQAAARRFEVTRSTIRQKIQSGELIYDSNRHKLVEASGSQGGAEGSQQFDSAKLPRGYWAETDRMILRLKLGERELLWKIVERLDQTIQAVIRKVRERNTLLGIEDEDLIQIGRIEITSLIEGYDPRLGTNTSAYMRQWLYHKILRAVVDYLPIRVPINFARGSDLEQRAAFFRSSTAYGQLRETPEDAFVGDEEGFGEVLRDDLYQRIVSSAPLSERDLYVLEHRFGLGGKNKKTLEQLGADLGLTRERVRQLQLKAVEKIKWHIYLTCGLNTGLDIGSDKRRPYEVSPAVRRGDFFLGEPPNAQPSISAVQEWAEPIHSYKESPEIPSRLKHAHPVRSVHPVTKREAKRHFDLHRPTPVAAPPPDRGQARPATLRKEYRASYEQVLLEALMADDGVARPRK